MASETQTAIKNILVVEDESNGRAILEEAFGGGPYRVVSAADGQEARERLENTDSMFDIGIFDLRLPERPETVPTTDVAIATIRHAKRLHPNIVLIATPSVLTDALRTALKEIGVAEIFVKPFSAIKLRAMVDRLRDA